MFITKKHLARRVFLQGAGVALGLPLLDAMIPAATALANTAANPVKRAGWVFFPHGAILNERDLGGPGDFWTPQGVGREFALSPILASLAPVRDQVTVVSGLSNRESDTGQRHATRACTWLTCVKPSSGPINIGPSVDQLVARQVRDIPVPSIQLSAVNVPTPPGPFGAYYSYLSYSSATEVLPPASTLTLAFQQVFGMGSTAAMRASLHNETTSMLDMMTANVASLNQSLGPADRNVLDDYLASVREMEQRVQHQQQLAATPGFDIGDPPANPSNYAQRVDAMFDLVVLAFRIDARRIFTFLMDNEGGGSALGGIAFPTGNWDSTAHGRDTGGPQYVAALVQVQTLLTERFAAFVRKLGATADGDGSLLDHSMIAWGSNTSNSQKGSYDPLPTVLVGQGAGSIRGGQHLMVPRETPLANLWLTMLQRYGAPGERFGNSTGTIAGI